MVDINLFQDDEAEEEKKESGQDNTGQKAGDTHEDDLVSDFGDELNDDLGFGEDLDDDKSSDGFGDDILGGDTDIDESIPGYDELDIEQESDNYSGGGGAKKQSSSVFLWILLGVIAAAALFYFVAIVPRQKEVAKKQTQAAKRPDVQKLIEQMRRQRQKAQGMDSTKAAETAVSKNTTLNKKPIKQRTTQTSTTVSAYSELNSNYADVTDKIVSMLINNGQLGAFLVFDDGFAVEYNAAIPNSAQNLASKIGTLTGIKDLKISPEEKHKTLGQTRYWGVVSGKFPKNFTSDLAASGSGFTARTLSERLKSIARTQKLNIKKVQIFNSRREKGRKIHPVRLKLEGRGTDVLAYMKNVCSIRGNFKISKIMIAPVMLSDFHGKNLKVVLDLNVAEGNFSP
ncbi:hypothetical protein J7K93_01285 [bacterium]|nr:hypothetical protein [bacterium]